MYNFETKSDTKILTFSCKSDVLALVALYQKTEL